MGIKIREVIGFAIGLFVAYQIIFAEESIGAIKLLLLCILALCLMSPSAKNRIKDKGEDDTE